MLNDFLLPPANGRKPGRGVIFLHGLGDSGSGGLLSIGKAWQRDLPDCEFLCPDAPFAYDMAPPDFGGRQWFSLRNFEPAAMLAGTKTAAPILNEYIDHVLQTRGLAADKLALVGFSQGTMMALYTAPRRTPQIACVIGYSGALIGGENLAHEKKSSPPVLLVHGQIDEVVPYGAMIATEQALKVAQIPVTTVTCPMTGHGIDNVGIAEGLRFLKQVWKL